MRWSLAALLLGAGCGEEAWPPDHPRIVLEFIEQAPQAPHALRFSTEFTDSDGDLGRGRLEVFVNERTIAELAMEDVFSAQLPAVALTSTVGRFELVLELERELASGERAMVSMIAVDAKGHASNQPYVELEARGGGG